jgi:hypothetical protein
MWRFLFEVVDPNSPPPERASDETDEMTNGEEGKGEADSKERGAGEETLLQPTKKAKMEQSNSE